MSSSDTKNTAEAPASLSGGHDCEDGEPPTCTDLAIEDERWHDVEGLVALLPDLVTATLAATGRTPDNHTVSVALLSDTEVRGLNRVFRGKDAATNVLSFPSSPMPGKGARAGDPTFLGDIALAYDTVVDEARAQGKPVRDHAAHLVVHGVLHLTGFDHGHDDEAERMETAERAILARFHIPDPYREEAPSLEIEPLSQG